MTSRDTPTNPLSGKDSGDQQQLPGQAGPAADYIVSSRPLNNVWESYSSKRSSKTFGPHGEHEGTVIQRMQVLTTMLCMVLAQTFWATRYMFPDVRFLETDWVLQSDDVLALYQ